MRKLNCLIGGIIGLWLGAGIVYLIYLLNLGISLATALGYVVQVEIGLAFVVAAFVAGIFMLAFLLPSLFGFLRDFPAKNSNSTSSSSYTPAASVYVGRGVDERYIGRVGQSGEVYAGRGLEERYVGRVENYSGWVYKGRGLDERHVGRVASGRLYIGRDLDEQNIGRIDDNGRVYTREMSYVGRVENVVNTTIGGGAALILLF